MQSLPNDVFGVICAQFTSSEFIALAVGGRWIATQCESYVERCIPTMLLQQFPTAPGVVTAIEKTELYTVFHYRFIRATMCYCGRVAWDVGKDCPQCAADCDLCDRRLPWALTVTFVSLESGAGDWRVCKFGCAIRCMCCRESATDPTELTTCRGMFVSATGRCRAVAGFLCRACRSGALCR